MSHRSYHPSNSCGSKLLQQRWDKTYYDEHRRLVKSAKAMVDTSTPHKPPHVTAKWKKQQLEKERAEEIERDNHTLMCKMKKIMEARTSPHHRKHHSLNEQKRQRELERVARENKAMLERLQKVRPVYRISDWVDDWQRSEELTQRITAYPSTSPAGRSKSASHCMRHSLPPASALQRTESERETAEGEKEKQQPKTEPEKTTIRETEPGQSVRD